MAREIAQIVVFGGIAVAGLLWGRGALRRWNEYSFSADFKSTFLRVRWGSSGDLLDGTPRLIVPAMLVATGLGLLASVLIQRLSE